MISKRGLVLHRPPGNYHTDRLRKMPVGYFFDVITNGYGIMYSQSGRVKPDDRWAIVAYLRVLQASQNASSSQLTPKDMQELEKAKNPTTSESKGMAEGAGH